MTHPAAPPAPQQPGPAPVIVETAPLSPGQERLIDAEFLRPDGGWPALGEETRLRPIDTAAIRIDGPLDHDALQCAVSALIQRQHALRTRLHRLPNGTAVQLVAAHLPDTVTLSSLPAGTVVTPDVLAAQTPPHVDPRTDPLFRAHLVRLGAERHVLLLQIHHFVSDGWSIGVLYRDLSALYNAARSGRPAQLPPLKRSFAALSRDMHRERRSPFAEAGLAYWRQRLALPRSRLAFADGNPAPYTGLRRVDVAPVRVPRAVVDALRASARTGHQRGPVAGPFLAALALVLHHQSAATDIRIGMMISNRARPEAEHLIGYFVNTAVIRLGLHPGQTAAELVGTANAAVREALEHQALPIQDVTADLNRHSAADGTPLYQVTVALNAMRTGSLTLDDADCRDLDLDRPGPRDAPTSIDQRWVLEEQDRGLVGTLTCQSAAFGPPRVRICLDNLDRALRGVAVSHHALSEIIASFQPDPRPEVGP
ncbi:condensation domain-containing protein [Streptomyces sp. NPDC096311]|uniref:condensation domain-containing protein n=1 Tax=Streptomyces sp. NPDC096311 TaxID=3366083 RepID=UPI003811E7AC